MPQPTKLAEAPLGETDEGEDILDRFTDPSKKRKRKEKKEKHEEEKKIKLVNAGKRWAKDAFNTPPTTDDLVLWAKFVEPPVPTLADLEHLHTAAEHLTVEGIGYEPLAKTGGFFAVMDCLNAMVHCSGWLKDRLARVGWKINMTGYEPTAVSHSTNEVLPATLECYRMAIKQMILFVKHSSSSSSSSSVATPQ